MATQFHPLLGRAVAPRPSSCLQCRKRHRSCDMAQPACARCSKLRVQCQYGSTVTGDAAVPEGVSTVSASDGMLGLAGKPRTRGAMLNPNGSRIIDNPRTAARTIGGLIGAPVPFPTPRAVLASILLAAEEPIETLLVEGRIEDPDLLPTYEDFSLVYSLFGTSVYFRNNDFVVHNLLDKDRFLASFFAQPAPLRYILCALAAYTADPPLPIRIAISYFNKACRAVFRTGDKPSVRILEAVVLITTFALGTGQPSLGKPFFTIALRMLLQLNLHIDPDDVSNTMRESEKDELRMLFWRVLFHLKCEYFDSGKLTALMNSVSTRADALCITDFATTIDLEYYTVKSPPATDFTFLMQCNFGMWDVFSLIKRKLRVTPSSVSELLLSASELPMSPKVLHAYSRIPAKFILVPSLDHLTASQTTAQYDALIHQIMTSSPSNPMGIFQLSMNYHCSQCLFLRPILYLTAYLTRTSLVPKQSRMIQTALEECLVGAQRISILLKLSSYALDIKQLKQFELSWMRRVALVPSLFEAAVILYFVACRTKPEWRCSKNTTPSYASITSISDSIVHEFLTCILHAFHTLFSQLAENAKSNRPNMMTPLITCLNAMLQELSVKQGNSQQSNINTVDFNLDLILLEMKVLSLTSDEDDDKESSEAEIDSCSVATDEPWVYVGLLGIDINKQVRWNGPYEGNWRRLWEQLQV
ncbi:hypothetical protein HDU77_002698 [Chytriomyces hyalinus]|nr:hypothetical protein HDU77_002698 [Chytriomyces hyalinus]